uniref:Uncharacterized protein n=1 Tax=Arundo donax TaxID=35708 RepID=A0A0A9APX1_ARUDO
MGKAYTFDTAVFTFTAVSTKPTYTKKCCSVPNSQSATS